MWLSVFELIRAVFWHPVECGGTYLIAPLDVFLCTIYRLKYGTL